MMFVRRRLGARPFYAAKPYWADWVAEPHWASLSLSKQLLK